MCCHAGDNPDLKKYNSLNTAPFDFFLSDEMEEIRNKMLSGEKIKGCETCYLIEDRGYQSWRQWKYNNIYKFSTEPDKVSLKLRVFGSYCNLGCYMCHPYNSSTRRKDIASKDLGKYFNDEDEVAPIKLKRYDEIISSVLENIDIIEKLQITGGESLQLPRLYEFLDKIPDKNAKNIVLGIDTNLTMLEFKNHNIWQIIDRFKRIELGVSSDHFGEKLKWIRYPINVDQFEKNLEIAKDYVHNINVTVSILNIRDLFEIVEYYKPFNVTLFNVVSGPRILSIKNLPQGLKDIYKLKYKDNEGITQELNRPRVQRELEQGIDYCRKLGKGRNIDFDETFKELLLNIR